MAAEIEPAGDVEIPAEQASMRPRRMAAEIVSSGRARPCATRRFNEAAANGRGNRHAPELQPRTASGFNEAAANGRGNHPGVRRRPPRERASMRPRRMAAEIW